MNDILNKDCPLLFFRRAGKTTGAAASISIRLYGYLVVDRHRGSPLFLPGNFHPGVTTMVQDPAG